jgi:acyl-CoA reductase-like NAD-dependent aldehyde dehydrogenase
MRTAQHRWALRPVRDRLRIVRRVRAAIAERSAELEAASRTPQRRGPSEGLVAEVLPLADACRFLEREAPRLLAPRRRGRRGRPGWLSGVRLDIRREPFGRVLVIGASNYPLLLPGVQALQALVTGNAVVVKPGTGGRSAAELLGRILQEAGLPEGLYEVLDESPEAARQAIAAGVDKVVLTGSARTGEAVLNQLAGHLVPSAMELSGCDAVFVRPDADLDLVVRSLRFGLQLNGSATCIAPRRVFAPPALMPELEGRLAAAVAGLPAVPVPPSTLNFVTTLIRQAVADGGRPLNWSPAGPDRMRPVVVADARPGMRLLQEDVFAPVLSLVTAADDEEALAADARCPYALGAAVFGGEAGARRLACRIAAGAVVVNDLIVPTADPRFPFSGRGRSGFGVTRGAEGLLELTTVKAVAVRRARFRPHLDDPLPADEGLFRGWLLAAHGRGAVRRCIGLRTIVRALRQRTRSGRSDGTGSGGL